MGARVLILLCLSVIASFFGFAIAHAEMGTTSMHILDVGQGDAILLRSGTADVLVDGGPDSSVLERVSEVRPSWDRRIELLVLTHPQRDHLQGFLPLLDRFQIGAILLPDIPSTSPALRTLLARAKADHIPVRFARAGQRVHMGSARILVLAPDDRLLLAARRNANNGSVVLRVEMLRTPVSPSRFVSLLLTGDIERQTEAHLVQRWGSLLDVDVLKIPHHGSRTSTSRQLLDAVTPALGLISVGKGNSYGHPAPGILRRLRNVPTLRTDESGTISLVAWKGVWLLRCQQRCGSANPLQAP